MFSSQDFRRLSNDAALQSYKPRVETHAFALSVGQASVRVERALFRRLNQAHQSSLNGFGFEFTTIDHQ